MDSIAEVEFAENDIEFIETDSELLGLANYVNIV